MIDLNDIFYKFDPNYHVVAIFSYEHCLYAAPCADTPSGCYPNWEEKIKISNSCIDYFGTDVTEMNGILIERTGDDTFSIIFAEDSWDGFQPM